MWLTPFWAIGLLLEMVGLILIGVVFILFGVSKIVVRNETGQMGVTLAAGILFILAGGFFCSFFFDIIGYILLLPACIVGMTSLFLSLQ